MKSNHVRLISAMLVAFFIMSFVPTRALAKGNEGENFSNTSSVSVKGKKAPLILDCVNMSEEARKYAEKHGYCPKQGEPQTNAVVTGDCGWSYLGVGDLRNGKAQFQLALHSSQGNMININLQYQWFNYSTSFGQAYSEGIGVFSQDWNRTDEIATGPGFVAATMTGVVTLWWGGQCGIGPVSESNIITIVVP